MVRYGFLNISPYKSFMKEFYGGELGRGERGWEVGGWWMVDGGWELLIMHC